LSFNDTLSFIVTSINFCFLLLLLLASIGEMDVAPGGGSGGTRTPIESLPSVLCSTISIESLSSVLVSRTPIESLPSESFTTIKFHINGSAILQNNEFSFRVRSIVGGV
jgi:hypothetical protein